MILIHLFLKRLCITARAEGTFGSRVAKLKWLNDAIRCWDVVLFDDFKQRNDK